MNAIFVTGSNGGIGTAICSHFKHLGYQVFGTDISTDANKLDGYIQFDIKNLATKEKSRDEFFRLLKALIGKAKLKVLVNNAAIQILGRLEEIEIEDFTTTIDTNLVAPLVLSKMVFSYLKKNKGTIINVGSIHSKLTKPGFISYATSKSALLGLTQALAVDIGKFVRVNAILPAAIETQMLKEGFIDNLRCFNELRKFHPTETIGTPEEIAELIYFLAQSNNRFLNGSIVDISGGIHCRLHDPC